MSAQTEIEYGITTTLEGVSFEDAVERTRHALATEGFGVLTEIDIKATMKKKLDLEYGDYMILGACSPPLAHQALEAEPMIGLLLPCNVVVTTDGAGNAVVSAVDPARMFEIVGRADVQPIADEVRDRLERVIDALSA